MKDNATYTASAVIKTVNVTGDGAVLKFDIYDSVDTYLGQKLSEKVTETTDWKRVIVSITLDEAKLMYPNAAKLRVSIGAVASTNGDMYFDAVRMFEEDVKVEYDYGTAYNYVEDITNQLDSTINLIPDKRGNTLQATDPKNNIYTFEYDDLDRIKKIDSPTGLRSKYYYDANHNLHKIENDSISTGNINTSFVIAYNELALPQVITDAKGKNIYYEYDKNVNLSNIKYPNGKQIYYEYDSANRVDGITYSDNTPSWNFIYDKNSNLIYCAS
ncbi:RHS repeat domain-containing protein [Tepidibacter sp. Z1-5]|uniref:RHS repeat domain-containing protein n=1 Tax=Tepidibacter sp. Z1-5 TaxID=3134138 RepID=UPI0030C39844